MAEILGGQTILARALPTGVDATRLIQWRLKSGITWGEFVGRVSNALGVFNNELMQQWGDLCFITEEDHMEYPQGGTITPSPLITDLSKVDARSETTIAHMLDLLPYGDAVGGTTFFFRDAREAQLRAQVRGIVQRLRWRFELLVLNRLFTNTETSVGSSGYNVPFVRGTGGNVDFAPPAYGGETFSTSHDHYLGVDSDSYGYDDMLNQLAETIQEHGHEPPYTAYVARADVASYYALPDFVQPISDNIVFVDQGAATTRPTFFSRANQEFGRIGSFQSQYGEIELRATNRVPTTYAGIYKSYGQNNERNPIAIRIHPDEGFGARVYTVSQADDHDPIKMLRVVMELGVGVGEDRTNGSAAYLAAAGTWSNPTIT